MPILKVSFNKTTNIATVLGASGSVPVGSVEVGTFTHPDETYPDSYVIYHGVREILYKRSAADPSKVGFWPENITAMQKVSIVLDDTAIPITLTEIVATPTSLSLSLAADAANGKTVTFAPLPAEAALGNLFLKMEPNPSIATASIADNVPTVKPAGIGSGDLVIVTDGIIDVSIAITVTA